ncbi:MAG: VWA domain-containing protein [Clostridia bacterium]|nr:VWA domain-containing protein [Clostridia bacterium]
MKKKKIIIIVVIIILCMLVGSFGLMWVFNRKGLEKVIEPISNFGKGVITNNNKLTDDWQYKNANNNEEDSSKVMKNIVSMSSESGVSSSVSNDFSANDSTLGFSVGGAKNVENFRKNIKNNYLPISTDLTYNGLFYDYYFDTGRSGNTNSEEMFYPTYSTAVSKDPISQKTEYYMTVGLNSNIKESDFQRKKLNIVVVMDISGSMSSGFNQYYYGGNALEGDMSKDKKSKMQIANESLNCLIDQLKPDDRLGIVLFDNSAYLAKPVNLVGETDIEKIKEHILEITPKGGTNFEAGYKNGTELFTEEMINNEEYENRIIVITDAMPNLGNTSKEGLTKYVKENAEKSIYTSFIGVGVDFNTEVIECLADVKGANYYSVHNSDEFKKIMGEEFDYMVTPLVFDLELKLDTDEYEIVQVYGTDTKDKISGTIMKVNTLFPSSRNSDGEVKGGVILLKVKPIGHEGEIIGSTLPDTKIIVSYKDREGKKHENEQIVKFGSIAKEHYDNTGIRKAIVLTRYANLMKDWILFERMNYLEKNLDVIIKNKILVTNETGIIECPYTNVDDVRKLLGENERESQAINVSEEYVDTLLKFKEYMKNEIKEIDDNEMNQEIEILDLLVKE